MAWALGAPETPPACGCGPAENPGTGRAVAEGACRCPARERILSAAGELFAESGFDATPTSRIAERAQVPKGLIHYYFRRKQDLLVALVERLPDEELDPARIVLAGDVTGSLYRLVSELDRRFESSVLLSHLLWREADTHAAVRRALQERFDVVVRQIREVISAALTPAAPPSGGSQSDGSSSTGSQSDGAQSDGAPSSGGADDVDTAALLLARVVSHRHAVARHGDEDELDREICFIARALEPSAP